MAVFGSFETDREIYSDPIYTVYGAKKSGEPTSEYAVKVFSIQHVQLDEESSTQLEPLLSDIEKARVKGIEIQGKAAAASSFIAPVLESGYDNRGVWYATRFYPRSVNKIISGRVSLTLEAFQHIIGSIARGALDFKRACGRSHGDIRPSNVQISKSERLTKADVVLSDPLPGNEAEGARYELSDLRAIGQVMLQLVRQRAIEREEDFLILPILSGPEWTRIFGKSTERWLALCNLLLDPDLGQKQYSLEQLVAELESLRPKSGVSPKLIIAGSAAVIVLIGIVVFVMRPRSQTIEVTSDPPGAAILVNNKEQPQKTPTVLKLGKGNYTIDARYENLTGQSTNWVVSKGGTVPLHFQFPYGSISIKSEPPGATITADGKELGKTPKDIPALAAGTEVKYELSLKEHISKTVRGVVTNGQKLTLTETLPLTIDVVTVEISSTPQGAKIFWKDKLLIEKTPERTQLEQGKYALSAVYRDWPAKQKDVEIKRGEDISVDFYFENGKVVLESDPAGASVWSGTNRLGETPMTTPPWPAGTATFRFEHTGFETTNQTVTVADKRTSTVRASLLTTNGVFEFSSDPATATILDSTGKELGRTAPGTPLKLSMAPGNYSFGARVEGLNDITPLPLSVAKREVKKHTFVFNYGTVLLDSAPQGATITADGRSLGVTPATFIQKPGTKVNYRIVAPDYLPTTNEVILQSGDRAKSVVARLAPEPVSIELRSDPPGAQYFAGGTPVPANGPSFFLPWGTNEVMAKYPLFPSLGEQSQTLSIKKGAANTFEFKFTYGTLVLSNVLEEIKVVEAGKEVGSVPGLVRLAYEKPGPHTYDLFDGAEKVESIATNVQAGMTTVLTPKEAGEMRNSIGMKLVKVRNLLGPGKDGWVGKFEVTQGEYQKVMGTNPSLPVLGDDFPVDNVSWDQAMEFCQKLKASDEKKPPSRGEYRLPTREQWQVYAEGTEFKDAVTRAKLPSKVGSKAANPKHLYDVLGNVWEWLAENDGTNSSYIGQGYTASFGLDANKTEKRARTWSDNQVGFRVILVPTGATASAK